MSMIPSWLKRLSWQTALMALVSGGIIHIAATMIMPRFAAGNGVQRLAGNLPLHQMRIMPTADADKQLVPFIGPDLRVAVCRYDVSDGPITVSAVLPEKGWSLAIYSSQGDNFYVIPAQDYRRAEVTFQLVPQGERFLGFFNFNRTPEATASQVAVPEARGIVVVRAPVRGRAYHSETEAWLARAQCGLRS